MWITMQELRDYYLYECQLDYITPTLNGLFAYVKHHINTMLSMFEEVVIIFKHSMMKYGIQPTREVSGISPDPSF